MSGGAKKPAWVIDKERAKRAAEKETVWLFGLHAVRDALMNPAREKLRLVLTKNAFDKLEQAVAESGVEPEIVPIRGGTDGARLSWERDIPCPNLCTGGANFHGVHEFVPVASMEKMVQVLVELVRC